MIDKKENTMKKKNLIPNDLNLEKVKKRLYREVAKKEYQEIYEDYESGRIDVCPSKELTISQFNLICSYIYDNYTIENCSKDEHSEEFPRLEIYCSSIFYMLFKRLPVNYKTSDIENILNRLTCKSIMDCEDEDMEENDPLKAPLIED
jgi:hypothetical protein